MANVMFESLSDFVSNNRNWSGKITLAIPQDRTEIMDIFKEVVKVYKATPTPTKREKTGVKGEYLKYLNNRSRCQSFS